MSRCVILSAAPVKDVVSLRTLLRRDDVFFAADGGWQLAQRLGVVPEFLVADFDSMAEPVLPLQTRLERLPCHKDETDTAAAIRLGRERGYTDFLLLGCTGGRLDHQQANLLSMVQLAQQGCRAEMADGQNRIRVLASSPVTVSAEKGWKLSLFAHGGTVHGLTVCQVEYPLQNYDLRTEDPLCVSNELTEQSCTISFRDGILLLFLSKD